MKTLLDHLEHFCGQSRGGWSDDADAKRLPFQVVEFEGGPYSGVRTLSTLGLSWNQLRFEATGKHIRQELLTLYRDGQGPLNLPGVLQQVALECLGGHRALSRGEVIGPRGPLIDGHGFVSLYVAMPVLFPDEFHVFEDPVGGSIAIAWLVPITDRETAFVRTAGWRAFEALLIDRDPDLADLQRPSVVSD